MSNENARKNYTACADAEAEKLLDQVLSGIGEELKSSGLTVYLGGSYGRGEGGVRLDRENGILYNDLDFFVFARKKLPNAGHLLKKISHYYEQQLKVDVDFSKISSIREIKNNRNRLMMQELKRGYKLVCGEDLLAKYLPELPAEKLPFSEACRLLLNRGMGLLFAREKIAENSDDKDFILRNMYKAILASGDARLIADGKYRWRIAERREAILASDMIDRWKELYHQAVEFKTHPQQELPENMALFLEDVHKFYNESILAVSGAETSRQIDRGCYVRCRKSGELSIFNYVKFCIKTRILHIPERFLFMPPVAAVLCLLYDRTSYDAKLYHYWLKFN